MIKGHTKIELTNVKTGQKKILESDNMVTNGMFNSMQQTPMNFGSVWATPFSSHVPLVDKLCGGILLFHDTINEGVNNIFFPEGNVMIGNGMVRYATAQNVPEFGSYNAEESTYTINEGVATRKYVYDFATSKANGTISSVCLTNFYAGYVGAGNNQGTSERQSVDNFNFNNADVLWNTQDLWNCYHENPTGLVYADDVSAPVSNASSMVIVGANYEKNYIVLASEFTWNWNDTYSPSCHLSEGTLKLYKAHCPFNAINPLCRIDSGALSVYEEVDIEVPDEIKNLWSGVSGNGPKNYTHDFCQDDDNLYFISHYHGTSNIEQIPTNGMIYILAVSRDLTSSQLYSVKNNTGVALRMSDPSTLCYNRLWIHNGYLLVRSYSGRRLFKINLTDSTDVVEFTGDLTSNQFFFAMGGRVYLQNDNGNSVGTYIDTVNNVAKVTNGILKPYGLSTLGSYPNIVHVSGSHSILLYQNKSYGQIYTATNPMMLSTINNLDEPVTKTSDMTMKISYTLTGNIEQ